MWGSIREFMLQKYEEYFDPFKTRVLETSLEKNSLLLYGIYGAFSIEKTPPCGWQGGRHSCLLINQFKKGVNVCLYIHIWARHYDFKSYVAAAKLT